GFAMAMWAEDMLLSWRDNRLHFSAPKLHFLNGKPLQRLRDGAEIPFLFQITLSSGNKNHVFQKIGDRFVVSYDLWEEKFSVSKLGPPKKRAAHLNAEAAEAWCLEQLPMDVSGLKGSEKFWVRLEIRAQDPKENEPLITRGGKLTEDGVINLNPIIEI